MKQRHKTRGPLTPKKAGIAPKALLLTFTDHDQLCGRVPSGDQVLDAYARFLARDFTALGHDSPVLGELGECHRTVEAAIEFHGGTGRFGWLAIPQPVRTGKNALAGAALVAHTVWERDGRLYETIPAYQGLRFILDNAVVYGSQAGVNFLDTASDASRCGFNHHNLIAKVIELVAASDHRAR